MAKGTILNFDATSNSKDGTKPVRDFVRNFFDHARLQQQSKNEEFQRIVRLYRAQMNMQGRDPNRANVFVPALYTRVETIVPDMVDALLGVRPYIPIQLSKNVNADVGDAMTDLLDGFLDKANFYWEAVKFNKLAVLLGTSFLEALPDFQPKRVIRAIPQIMTDQFGQQTVVGHTTEEQILNLLTFKIRAYAPWEIFQDPFAKTINDTRGVIKYRGFTSKRQLKEMAKRGAFPDFDLDKLDPPQDDTQQDNWGERIALSMGVPMPTRDDDMGIWLSYESKDRYIDLWNGEVVLRDIPNPFSVEQGGHGGINLTKIINTDDPNPNTQWYGIGEGRPVEQLSHMLNEQWNQTFDNHNMQNEGVIFYAEDAFDVDKLVMVGGNRIPADIGPGQGIGDVFQERKTPGLPRDFYAIPAAIEGMIDDTTGIPKIARGATEPGGQTAREALIKKGATDSRVKLKIKMFEKMGLGGFGEQVLHHIEQFATPDDVVEHIGVERAALLPTLNPASMNGNYRFAFKGSDRMADAQIKRQDAKDIYQLMAGNMTINQEWLAGRTLKQFEVPDSELQQALRPDEEAMRLQAEAEAANSESARGVSNGRAIGGSAGNRPSGRDSNEKLGANI